MTLKPLEMSHYHDIKSSFICARFKAGAIYEWLGTSSCIMKGVTGHKWHDFIFMVLEKQRSEVKALLPQAVLMAHAPR